MSIARRRSRDEWAAVVEEYRRSGKSRSAFAREKRINSNTLAWWVSELSRSGVGTAKSTKEGTESDVRLVPVSIVEREPAGAAEGLEISFGDTVVRFPAGTDAAYVGQVLLEVRALC